MARFAPKQMIANAGSLLPEPDRQVMSDPGIQKGFISIIREALRQGPRGAQYESLLAITEWGFRPQDIHAPVLIWHGELDQNVPVAMARYLADCIPGSHAQFYSIEGHLSVFSKHAEQIIHSLVD
jgi:pimeloyl-ACP methyl ester carboxylesterase